MKKLKVYSSESLFFLRAITCQKMNRDSLCLHRVNERLIFLYNLVFGGTFAADLHCESCFSPNTSNCQLFVPKILGGKN